MSSLCFLERSFFYEHISIYKWTTATAVSTRIKAIKNEKNAEKIRNTYDEIVNELLSEREEAIRIAQVYKSELEKVVISDEDIEHLHKSVESVLEIIKDFQIASAALNNTELENKYVERLTSLEKLKELISVDNLKTMQLLGFNFKSAIGEPLTQICANKISVWGGLNSSKNSNQRNKRWKFRSRRRWSR